MTRSVICKREKDIYVRNYWFYTTILDALNNVVLIRNRKIKYLRQQVKTLKKHLVQVDVNINLAICQHIIAIHHRYKDCRHALAALL